MSINHLEMLQTKGHMQSQDLQLKQNQMSALNKSNISEAEKEKKLREACEGFESIFIQKMWQQMRATLPQENPLVGREEKFWQSMYDQELSKKMASHGGIGLADMMYDQLSQNLVSASRTTADSMDKNKGFEIDTTPLMPRASQAVATSSANPQSVLVEHAGNNATTATSSATSSATSPASIYDGAAATMGTNSEAQNVGQVATSGVQSPYVATNSASNSTGSTPLVEQYLNNLQAKQSGQVGQSGQAYPPLTGPELARAAQLTAANAPTSTGVLPQNAINNDIANTGANLLQSQIGGAQPHIIRTTYTTNMPENERKAEKQVKQLLTSGQPMVNPQIQNTYPYAANQSASKNEQTAQVVTPVNNAQQLAQAPPATVVTVLANDPRSADEG